MRSLFSDLLTKEMPAGWTSSRLGACLDLVRNGLSLEQNQEGRGVRVTRIETISEGTINTEKVGFVETDGDISEYLLKRGDVLFSHINSIKHIGKVAQFDNDEELYHGMNLLVLQFNGKVDKRFGYYFLASRQTKSICERMAKQAVNQASINTKEIRQLPIALPPLPEQRKIAGILSAVDEAIEKTDAIIRETQQLKKGLMQKLFTEGIGHTRFKETKIGRIPEEWDVVRLDSVCIGKAEYGAGESAMKYENGLIRYVRITDINADGTLNNDAVGIPPEEASKYILKEGDYLFARSGSVGLSYLYDARDGLCAFAGYLIRFRPRREQLLPTFLKHYCHSAIYWKWIHATARATTQSNINATEYSGLPIALPPLPEQRKIVEILSEVDTKSEKEQAFKTELERLKKGLMQVLLTGKVRVKV